MGHDTANGHVVYVREGEPTERQELADRKRVFVGHFARIGGQPESSLQIALIEDSNRNVGISYVYCEKHIAPAT